MVVKPHPANGNFNDILFDFIKILEGFVPRVYSDSKGIPTIGIGHALIEKLNGVWSTVVWPNNIGVSLNQADEQKLADILIIFNDNNKTDNEKADAAKAIVPEYSYIEVTNSELADENNKFSFTITLEQGKVIFTSDIAETENFLKVKLGEDVYNKFKDSKELIALQSMAFNSPKLIGDNITGYIKAGDRVGAWFEIRYRSNKEKDGGIANRRYNESHMFGLYNNPMEETEAEHIIDYFLHNDNYVNKPRWQLAYEYDTTSKYANNRPNDVDSYEKLLLPIADDVAKHFAENELNEIGQSFSINGEVILGAIADSDLWNGYKKAVAKDGEKNDLLVGVDTQNNDLRGNEGKDLIIGGEQSDAIYGGSGNDILIGKKGDDYFSGYLGDDHISGGEGEDTIKGGDGVDTIYGGDDNDVIEGGQGEDILFGDDGEDEISGGTENDFIEGGLQNDTLHGDEGDDTILGGSGNDEVYGDLNNDTLYGDEGDDHLFGGGGQDLLYGGDNIDWLYGGDETDHLYGEEGTDYLYGQGGSDYLYGGNGLDFYYADDGDTISDSDKDGIVIFQGMRLSHGVWEKEKNGYEGNDGLYTLSGSGLTFTSNAGGSVTILNYSKAAADLNITLEGEEDPNQDPQNIGGKVHVSFSSPLIFDLNQNGTTSSNLYETTTYFDLDADGFRQRTGWVEEGDGLLALDRNQNGTIDDGTELFGNFTEDENGNRFSDGFAALNSLDDNHNLVITAADDIYEDLRIWMDGNADGTSQPDELKSLSDLHITTISLSAQQIDGTEGRNQVTHQALFTQLRTDENGDVVTDEGGSPIEDQKAVKDVWFFHEPQDAVYDYEGEVPPEVLALPEMAGKGRVMNLSHAMAEDEALQSAVGDLLAAKNGGLSTLRSQADEVLALWTHTDHIDPDQTRGEQYVLGHYYADPKPANTFRVLAYARDIAILETFAGRSFEITVNGETR